MGVVRGVLLARPGAEGATGGTLQELVRRLPGDLFRTCLARVRAGTYTLCKGFCLCQVAFCSSGCRMDLAQT